MKQEVLNALESRVSVRKYLPEMPPKADLETIRATGERAAEAVALIVDGKTDEAMNRYNG